MPMAIGTKPMPSARPSRSSVMRGAPLLTSMPTNPSSKPISTMATAFAGAPCARTTAPVRPSTIRLKYSAAVVLAHGAPEKAVAMVLIGLLLGLVGIDVNTGAPRMTMGLSDLGDGIGFVPIAIGMFGVAELAVTLGRPQDRSLLSFKLRDLWPSWAEIRQC